MLIKNIFFSYNCLRLIDELVIFNILIKEKGMDFCFVVFFGDGIVFGFGFVDCVYEKFLVEFINFVENNFFIEYDYVLLGSYDVSL